ncbi:glycoside hydrolase family 130 protein [Pseudobacter ginsenosidimutans]|uniref:Putative GH43/DUF377 family glycosyl hydrolase n=1 Tax=Pseudobacter ginsenosidimutans TaxID=661488 RepID=A0A4Q7N478_9BACT|nr:glycoside hydrolase family 130 protein [Pseudobacter ginsenosidimutans]QEC44329.1 glycosidase [Pseudobacter ginsenosidimutans]RZS75791.1 putative GH43/DUF377 family glycosyl hydrolase [Pseudobacter ginsenosidimutans]
MKLQVKRFDLRLNPDVKKVIPRFFNTGAERSLALINRVMQLSKNEVQELLQHLLAEFQDRYSNIQLVFENHYEAVQHLIPSPQQPAISYEMKLLIGSYFTMEYSLEHAALFNPSIVEDPDQSGAGEGEKNVILSFRATGEGHVSSLVFKRAKLTSSAGIQFDPPGKYMNPGKVIKSENGYELHFEPGSLLSERVIFPVSFSEKNGIEDARFTRFINEDGSGIYLATYTAYDGTFIIPHLIETQDFLHFKMTPLQGKTAINKNLALFPRKVNGQYVMISRIDGVNNYIMFSDDLYRWDNAILLQRPENPWEFVQIGNAGSPLETPEGWLMITHGVGPMRKYCLGASLLDLNDPTKELGRLKEPLLMPEEEERYGYVPNVVYSCGTIIHGDQLFIPYAVSDYATSFATVPLKDLLALLR